MSMENAWKAAARHWHRQLEGERAASYVLEQALVRQIVVKPPWLDDLLTYIAAAEAKHPGEPPNRDACLVTGSLMETEQVCRFANDGGWGSWQTAVLEEACEYAREPDPAKRRVELLQLIAVAVRALCAMDGAR